MAPAEAQHSDMKFTESSCHFQNILSWGGEGCGNMNDVGVGDGWSLFQAGMASLRVDKR